MKTSNQYTNFLEKLLLQEEVSITKTFRRKMSRHPVNLFEKPEECLQENYKFIFNDCNTDKYKTSTII